MSGSSGRGSGAHEPRVGFVQMFGLLKDRPAGSDTPPMVMRLSIAGLGLTLLVGMGLGPADESTGVLSPTTRATSQAAASRPTAEPATTRPASDAHIRDLIRQLAAPSFRERDAAQRRLTELGAAALPTLVEFVNDPDPEIATRVSSILRPPADPALRVRLALAWIRTLKAEQVERAVYMVFDDAEHCDAAFKAAAKDLDGPAGRAAAAVAGRLADWRRQHEVFLRTYEKARKRNPESAERLAKTQVDSKLYQAEAAYWEAMEAIDGDDGKEGGADVQAAGGNGKKPQASPAAATQPVDGG